MVLNCPTCGSRNLRYAQLRTPSERLASLVGIRPLRCRDCRERFTLKTWKLSDLSYARCPNCLGMRLTTWSPSQYRVPLGRGFLLFFGWSPLRCEPCRNNFVSIRPRKYRYSRASGQGAGGSTESH